MLFETKHVFFIFAPAEDFTLASHSVALFIACKDLGDLVWAKFAGYYLRPRHRDHLLVLQGRLGLLWIPAVAELAEFIDAPRVDVTLAVEGKYVVASRCNCCDQSLTLLVGKLHLVKYV